MVLCTFVAQQQLPDSSSPFLSTRIVLITLIFGHHVLFGGFSYLIVTHLVARVEIMVISYHTDWFFTHYSHIFLSIRRCCVISH